MFSAGLLFRLLLIVYLARAKPMMMVWGVNEAGAIARWIVTTHAFASPFHDATGPTAWLAPIYPMIVAVSFVLFGIQTLSAAMAMATFNAVCSALTGVVVYLLAKQLASEKAATIAGWLWELSPSVAMMPFILWDTSLSALALSLALLQTLRLMAGESRSWGICGGSWGVAALLNPALCAPFPLIAILLARRGKLKAVGIMTGLVLLFILPWTVRNHAVLHKWIPIRSNGLTEVYFANCGFETHPLGNSMEYQRLGEAEFTSRTSQKLFNFVVSHPFMMLRASFLRAPRFWVNPLDLWQMPWMIAILTLLGMLVTWRDSKLLAQCLLVVLAVYPLIYYFSQVVSRYRHPIDPVMYALAGVALSRFRS
jgi:hypothetical protein